MIEYDIITAMFYYQDSHEDIDLEVAPYPQNETGEMVTFIMRAFDKQRGIKKTVNKTVNSMGTNFEEVFDSMYEELQKM